jgi:hypothetical protein
MTLRLHRPVFAEPCGVRVEIPNTSMATLAVALGDAPPVTRRCVIMWLLLVPRGALPAHPHPAPNRGSSPFSRFIPFSAAASGAVRPLLFALVG